MMSLKPFFVALAALLAIAFFSEIKAKGASAKSKYNLEVKTEEFTLARLQPGRTRFGQLLWQGGIVVSSRDARFGGFSGLALSADGKRFAAISDRSWWFHGSFLLKNNILTGVKHTTIAPLKIARKRPFSSNWADSEALAPWNSNGIDGSLIVGFERRERVFKYNFGRHGVKASPKRIAHPNALSSGPFNRELEAVGRFYAGPLKNWLLAISEENLDKNGNIRAWLWRGRRVSHFSLKRFKDYAITDLAVAPDGKTFFTLERSFNLPRFPGFAVRRFISNDVKHNKSIAGELMFEGRQPFFAVDNMEGLAIHKQGANQIYLTLISDDNYRRNLQRTLIFRFKVDKNKSGS